MSQTVQLFKKEDLGMVRILGDKDNPLFCLKDVCEILEHTTPAKIKDSIIKEFGDDLNQIHPIVDNLGRTQKATFITEPQLYFVLMRSDKPKAKPFRQWVINEVLVQLHSGHKENNKQLQVFNFNNTKLDYGIYNGEPVFNLNAIAEYLEIKNLRQCIDTNDKDYVIKLTNSEVYFTYNRNLNNRGELFLTEAGLYKLIMRSNKPSAEAFQKWVVKEVLPSIRKTGTYTIKNKKEMQKEKPVSYSQKLRAVKLLKEYSDLYRDKYDGRYSQILDSYVIKELTGENILPLPERIEHYYTAEEVGKIVGISANKVGRIANLNHLKNEKYGKWFIDKAKYTNKEVEAFRYNQTGIDYIKQMLV